MNTPNYETIGSIVLAGSGGKEDSARLTSGAAPVRVRVSIALISAVLGIGVFACSGLAAGQTGPQMRLTLECDKQTPLPSDSVLETTRQILQTRLQKLDLQRATVETDAANRGRFVVTLPTGADSERAKNLLTYLGQLELRPVAEGTSVPYTSRQAAEAALGKPTHYTQYDGDGKSRETEGPAACCEIAEMREKTLPLGGNNTDQRIRSEGWVIVESQAIIKNADVIQARAGLSQFAYAVRTDPSGQQTQGRAYQVSFQLTEPASKRFGTWTESHLHYNLAIMLDGVVISAPEIQSRISDRGEITGAFDKSEAEDLAIALAFGALPVKLRVVGEETLTPKRNSM